MKFGIIIMPFITISFLLLGIDWYFFIKRLNKQREEIENMVNEIKNTYGGNK
jgi:preprotein translocase subunit YajC